MCGRGGYGLDTAALTSSRTDNRFREEDNAGTAPRVEAPSVGLNRTVALCF